MKTLILTSYLDFYEKDENGQKIAHSFGNENGILDCLKKETKKKENFLFVSNGVEGEKSEQYFRLASKSFELTMPFENYNVLNNTTKDKAQELVENADLIFLCGGHLPTQNKFFNDIGLGELLAKSNAVIVGGSAGSMNCADVVYCPPELEEEICDSSFNRYLPGLALTSVNILPHFEQYREWNVCGKNYVDDIILPDSFKTKILALNNGSYAIIKNNNMKVYGESYLLNGGKIELLCGKEGNIKI